MHPNFSRRFSNLKFLTKIYTMSFANLVLKRSISTSTACYGKRNFKKFMLYNKRGSRLFKQQQIEKPDPEIPIYKRGVRDVGFSIDGKFVTVPEKIPELIVPDLTNCQLKPYVSYRAADVVQSEFTAKDLFDAVYSKKILEDFKNNKLNNDGAPTEPNAQEKITSEEAKLRARQTGSDIF